MKVYLVGGAVRDALLGIADAHTERDWVVVGASVEQMLDLGYRQVGKDFPVFLHPETHEEYALARLERKVAEGYHGFAFDTDARVSLTQDLSRRDLTINAMAEDQGRLIDPFNGQHDLNQGLLKHVSDAFKEDPVRVLRVARFAARFQSFGFKVAHSTHHLMQQMVASGEVDALTPNRVFKELDQALSYATPSAFFKVLSACGAYQKIFPMLADVKHQNHSKAFAYLDALDTPKPELKFAIWLKDESQDSIKSLCRHIKCPKYYQQLALLNSQFQQLAADFTTQSAEAIFDFFARTDALRRQDRFADLLHIFVLLKTDTTAIIQLRDSLKGIDITQLDPDNIGKAVQARKYQMIDLFLNTTQ